MNRKFIKHITDTIACLIGLLCLSATSLDASGDVGTPTEVFPSPYVFPASNTTCSFPVEWTVNGKTKIIQFSKTRFLAAALANSHGQVVEVMNQDNSMTINLNVSGAWHQTVNNKGEIVTVITGRNMMIDHDVGMVLAIGTFSFVYDTAGTLIQPLIGHGHGQLINVCALIS